MTPKRKKILKYTMVFLAPKIALALFLLWSIAPVATDAEPVSSTKVLARDGSVLYEAARPDEGLRTAVSLDRMPTSLQDAVIATEDKRFYSHSGIDRIAMLRAGFQFITTGEVRSGASTIEMQLMKNLFFASEPRSVAEKAREMVAAEYWALTHSKNETLEKYLNTIPLGNGTNGVQAASQRYFRKDVSDDTVGESALLAGMMNAPSRFDPYRHQRAALERRSTVLSRMVASDRLDASVADEVDASVPVIFAPRNGMQAPHFVESVFTELEERFPGIRDGGYVITTTLDPDLQLTAERIVEHRLQPLAARNVNDAAVIEIDPRTGDILAYVGSADYWNKEISGAIDMIRAPRQPGSALKPFLVFDALRNGDTPATVIADLPTRFEVLDSHGELDGYYPKNFTSKFNGPVTIRDALGSSLNVPMVKLLDERGLVPFFSTLRTFGITFKEHPEVYGKSVILGGAETSLHDVARGYARLATYGHDVETRSVLEVRDARGKVVYQSPITNHRSLFPSDPHTAEQAAALTTDILSDKNARSLAFGEANLLDMGKGIAAKSGTTKDFRDNLAFGYSPERVVGVWVGNADRTPMQGITGVTGAVPILHDVFLSQYAGRDPVPWPDPGGIVTREICLPSGKLVTVECPKRRMERFMEGTEPEQFDDWWKTVGKKLTLVPPAEYAEWARRARYESPGGEPEILSPIDGDRFVIDERLPIELQKIPFTASAPGKDWILNGNRIKMDGTSSLWDPVKGEYALRLDGTTRTIHFSVR